jgi:hypothetical protein
MKKLLVVLLLGLAAPAFAQGKLTQAALEGSWKAVKITDPHISIDVGQKTAVISEQGRQGRSNEEVAAEEKTVVEGIAQYEDIVLAFTGGRAAVIVSGEEKASGTYSVGEDGSSIKVDFDTPLDLKATLKGDMLHVDEEGTGVHIDYKKVK